MSTSPKTSSSSSTGTEVKEQETTTGEAHKDKNTKELPRGLSSFEVKSSQARRVPLSVTKVSPSNSEGRDSKSDIPAGGALLTQPLKSLLRNSKAEEEMANKAIQLEDEQEAKTTTNQKQVSVETKKYRMTFSGSPGFDVTPLSNFKVLKLSSVSRGGFATIYVIVNKGSLRIQLTEARGTKGYIERIVNNVLNAAQLNPVEVDHDFYETRNPYEARIVWNYLSWRYIFPVGVLDQVAMEFDKIDMSKY